MEFLGEQLAAALHQEFSGELSEIDVVVPIPLYWYRRLSRGYNQAEAIARPLAKRLGIESVRALWRTRHTRAQARLHRSERLANVARVLQPTRAGRRQIAGKRVLLVDDVTTTGATMAAAVRALNRCDVKSVTPIAVAATLRAGQRCPAQMLAIVEDRGFRLF